MPPKEKTYFEKLQMKEKSSNHLEIEQEEVDINTLYTQVFDENGIYRTLRQSSLDREMGTIGARMTVNSR